MYFKHVYPGGLVEYLTLKRSSVISVPSSKTSYPIKLFMKTTVVKTKLLRLKTSFLSVVNHSNILK